MIRSPKPLSPEQQIKSDLKNLRAEIARYEAPSHLGAKHDAHVRERWNAHIAVLRDMEATKVQELAEVLCSCGVVSDGLAYHTQACPAYVAGHRTPCEPSMAR